MFRQIYNFCVHYVNNVMFHSRKCTAGGLGYKTLGWGQKHFGLVRYWKNTHPVLSLLTFSVFNKDNNLSLTLTKWYCRKASKVHCLWMFCDLIIIMCLRQGWICTARFFVSFKDKWIRKYVKVYYICYHADSHGRKQGYTLLLYLLLITKRPKLKWLHQHVFILLLSQFSLRYRVNSVCVCHTWAATWVWNDIHTLCSSLFVCFLPHVVLTSKLAGLASIITNLICCANECSNQQNLLTLVKSSQSPMMPIMWSWSTGKYLILYFVACQGFK